MSSPPREQLVTHSPSPIRRRSSTSSPGEVLSPARLSPTLARSYDLNNPQVRERQRTMDVDMAMQLSRARRDTHSASPVDLTRPHNPHTDSMEPHSDGLIGFPNVLSPNEQHEIDIARGEVQNSPFVLTPSQSSSDLTASHCPTREEIDRLQTVANLHALHHDHGHDPNLLVSQDQPRLPTYNVQPSSSPPPPVFGALPKYQAHIPDRSSINATFDFGPMETFAATEKTLLGLSTPLPLASRLNFKAPAPLSPRRQAPLAESNNEQPTSDAVVDTADETTAESSNTPRMRQRKLSQSNPSPRVRSGNTRATKKGKGKMALFEAGESQGMSLPGFSFGIATLGESFLNGHGDNGNANTGDTYAYTGSSGAGGILNTGHDRPYRFSFYSNALSATIHARSLSELPAEGQTFEQLFGGEFAQANGADEKKGHGSEATPVAIAAQRSSASYFSARAPPVEHPRQASSRPTSGAPKANPNALTGGMIGSALANTDVESMTWWLDVQSPTDEEMKMLSKVFTIHPLTTEDIQMEETREKIELFRNYYLVCFRSFDQDPYSPTHLEPLNMYIIVFREGILSFHFRPTPHPQNVRRRINQLKDYISVTSDWISYALIDDITDAFGPLIQGIEYEVDSIDELVLILKEAETTDMLRRIGTCRKKVMGLLRLMGNKADVVKGLAKRCNENWRVAPTSDIGLYLSDIQDHLITMTQNLNHYEKILSRSHSNYLAQISIEMTDANNQINDVLSKLTALGTVLIPMNLVTGLWGMNVHVPGEETEGLKWFASIIACLAAFALIGGYSTYKFMVRR